MFNFNKLPKRYLHSLSFVQYFTQSIFIRYYHCNAIINLWYMKQGTIVTQQLYIISI